MNKNKNNLNMVAIGGGFGLEKGSKPHVKTGMDLTGVESPELLIVPSAKHPNKFTKSMEAANRVFGDDLGLKLDILHGRIDETMPSIDEMVEKIANADALYVSGGNSPRMFELWEKYGIDKHLVEAAVMGKVVMGSSAGALAWFDRGFSNPNSLDIGDLDYEVLDGLGVAEGIVAPHYNKVDINDEPRSKAFDELVLSNREKYAVGIEEGAALIVENGLIRVAGGTRNGNIHILGSSETGSLERTTLSDGDYYPN